MDLTEYNGIVLRENRIILPESVTNEAIEICHQGNMCITKCKALLREKVYWKGLLKIN